MEFWRWCGELSFVYIVCAVMARRMRLSCCESQGLNRSHEMYCKIVFDRETSKNAIFVPQRILSNLEKDLCLCTQYQTPGSMQLEVCHIQSKVRTNVLLLSGKIMELHMSVTIWQIWHICLFCWHHQGLPTVTTVTWQQHCNQTAQACNETKRAVLGKVYFNDYKNDHIDISSLMMERQCERVDFVKNLMDSACLPELMPCRFDLVHRKSHVIEQASPRRSKGHAYTNIFKLLAR